MVVAEVLDGSAADGLESGGVLAVKALHKKQVCTQVHGDGGVKVAFACHVCGVVTAKNEDNIAGVLDGGEAGNDSAEGGVAVCDRGEVVNARTVVVAETGVTLVHKHVQENVCAGGGEGVEGAEDTNGVSGVFQTVEEVLCDGVGVGMGGRCHDVEGCVFPLHKSHRFLMFRHVHGSARVVAAALMAIVSIN